MPRLRLALVAALALALTACFSGGIRPGGGSQERWQLRGKIGLRAPQLAESAYVNWRQCGDDFIVRISGPLGRTVARIDGNGERLTMQFEGRDPVTTREPEALMQRELGWSLPLRALRYWVRARAAPDGTARFSGPRQQPDSLQQRGWRIDYLAWHENGALALPAKLKLRREGEAAAADGLQATLLISEWQLGDASDCPPLAP